jgi:DNA end-binding protein Ku
MAGRPFWSGQLRISLVSFGIQLFPATNPTSGIAFHQIDRKTKQRVHHLNVIDGDHPVDDSQIVKGYEYSKGKYVIVEPEEVKKLRLETQKTIAVSQFVNADELPPYLYDKPYFVVPDPKGGSLEAFAVVREAMLQAGKIAIGEVAFAGREHLLAIAPPADKKERGLMAYTLRYAEELRDADSFFSGIAEHSIDKKQLALANELIKSNSAPFDLNEFKDDYEAALKELIEARKSNSPLAISEEKPRAKVIDLMDALKRSVDETKKEAISQRTVTRKRSQAGKVWKALA